MSEHVFSLLHTNMGFEAMLSADMQTRWGARRPEILIPLRADEEMPHEDTSTVSLEIGDQVRAVRAPYMGKMGKIVDLPAQPRVMESGARLRVGVVEMEDKERVSIPLANLELIH
jgi:hypothetical protein